jgi:cystathionine beta-lyase
LKGQPEVTQVLHPAVPGSPGHDHWKSHCTAAAGLFSVMFDPRFSAAQVHAFVDALKIFKIGFSWGGPMSLAVPYDLDAMRNGSARLAGHLVRFSIGLEALEALQQDVEAGLKAAFRS